jgi:hypothetical protein
MKAFVIVLKQLKMIVFEIANIYFKKALLKLRRAVVYFRKKIFQT